MCQNNPQNLPLVFACAGSSPVAKLSWEVAKELENRGLAEMSCLAGVAARKNHFLKQLRDRPVWVIDGCPIACGVGIFELIGARVDRHIRLDEFGLKKYELSPEQADLDRLIERICGAEQDDL